MSGRLELAPLRLIVKEAEDRGGRIRRAWTVVCRPGHLPAGFSLSLRPPAEKGSDP